MKVAIITLYGFFNYGNRLQNYALQTALENLGVQAETIVGKENIIKYIIKRFFYKDGEKVKLLDKKEIIREHNFRKFSSKYISTKKVITEQKKFTNSLDCQYEHYIVGSDQVWNPLFWGGDENSYEFNNYLLKFVSPQKRIAYAASFGISELPAKWEIAMIEEIGKFEHISLREIEGKEILENKVQQNLVTVLDPTMLVEVSQWRKLTKKIKWTLKKPYILTCFLGECSMDVKNHIEELAAKENKMIVELMDVNSKYYLSGPEMFLTLIDNAELVFTDSYHTTIFSILFHTPFVVVNREHSNKSDMSGRVSTLLKTFGLQDRFGMQANMYGCDFSQVENILKEEREKSLEFLKNALGLDEYDE